MDNYPLLNLFLTMLWLFLWVIWLFLLFRVFSDLFRSHDLNGWAKAGWVVFVLVLPYLGVLVYLIARGGSMHQRDVAIAKAQDQSFKDYVRDAAGAPVDVAGQLERLAALRDTKVISEEEFATQKARVLAS